MSDCDVVKSVLICLFVYYFCLWLSDTEKKKGVLGFKKLMKMMRVMWSFATI